MDRFLIFVSGLLFGTGVVYAGMANPAKVLNFFDIFGAWDPSLAFVMMGALAVTIPGFWLVFRRPHPLFAEKFSLPTAKQIDLKLVGGSAVFGLGWGIAGFCPGASLPMMSTLDADVLSFVAALVVGMFAAKSLQGRRAAWLHRSHQIQHPAQ